ncbi:hypothetical protein [uncultured Polaribacter sp.]|uniref:hypothetical protein n=1 Tax=uncultured Polaribacter sp. TaxID=174711 RepID=UPI0026103794|nr:hypothetical protein [uncultured Polaribacter sp.]
MKKQYLILGLFLASFQFASAQFTLEGEFRPRTELFNNGFNYKYQPKGGNTSGREGTTAFIGTSVRAALNSTYTTDSYKLYLGIQEVFNFGDRQQISASGNANFRVQEAWAEIKLADTWSFKIGRQPLSYDDQRILGGLAWAQQARTHDVGVFKHKSKSGFAFDAGYSLNTNGDNVFGNSALFTYRELAFIHANKKMGKLSLSGLLMNTTFQDDQTLNNNAGTPTVAGDDFNSWGETKSNLLTAGIHAKLNLGTLGLAGNFYIQSGDRIGETEVKGASLFSLDATYKANTKIILLAGFESISGTTDDSAAFFPLYGTNHKFNGLMDRFYVENHAIGSGLIDLNIGAKFKLPNGYNLTAKFHNFKEESRNKNSLGNEIDLVVAKTFKGFKLVAGYSQFFESDDFPNPAGNPVANDTQNWAWAMLIIKPKFLSGTK